MLFSEDFDPHPRNANNIQPYTFVTLFSGKADPHPSPTALRYVTLEFHVNTYILRFNVQAIKINYIEAR